MTVRLAGLGWSWFLFLALPAFAGEGPGKLPAEAKAFVEKGTRPHSWAAADLNRDGKQDLLLVLEEEKDRADNPQWPEYHRILIVLVRQPGGKLKEVKRNGKLVLCSACGGVFGDPFEGISAGPGTFTVRHYGGSSWRWSNSYRFNYSRRDRTWQLVKVTETSFHVAEPEKEKSAAYTPPKDFGKIDLADFDPDDWKGKGPK